MHMEGYKIPSWQETIEDYFRVLSGLEKQDLVSYMRHIRPFLEKLAFLIGASLMPEDLFEEVMNLQANFLLKGEEVSIRRVPQDRALGGSEYFRLIWVGYYYQNKIPCSNPKSLESQIKKRLYAYSETLQLVYGLASTMAVHTNNSLSSFDVKQKFVHSTIRSFVDYLISYEIV